MRSAGVEKSVRRAMIEDVKRNFLGREEEDVEPYTTKVWSALERSGVGPPYADKLAKIAVAKTMVKHVGGKDAKATTSFFIEQAAKYTPLVYDILAKRAHRVITSVLENPTAAKAEYMRHELKRIVWEHAKMTETDPFSTTGILYYEMLKRPARFAQMAKKGNEAVDEYVKQRKRKLYREYSEKIIKLAGIMNQLDSALFTLRYGLPHIPKGTFQTRSMAYVNSKEEARKVKEFTSMANDIYLMAVRDTLRSHGMSMGDVRFRSKEDILRRLEEMKEELEELFPHLRKKLKKKETS